MRAIFRRELQGYFFTPIGYVFVGVFLLLGGIFFGAGNLAERSGNMTYLLRNMSYLWMLLCPILTMRLFAGERSRGTDQMLLSSPVSLTSIVLGKFFAACTVMMITVVLTFTYPVLVILFGKLYFAETAATYLGFILQGGCFIALDILLTSLAHSQVTAAILAFGVNLAVWLSDAVATALHGHVAASVLSFFSLNQRFTPFAMGQISYANLLYSLLFMSAMLFLCVRILNRQRTQEE
ncbi:MAG: ABC transporter permease subunit [Clostridia bacterium]|nr:ABC transporter permease subunit [Clostridia bacterium]